MLTEIEIPDLQELERRLKDNSIPEALWSPYLALAGRKTTPVDVLKHGLKSANDCRKANQNTKIRLSMTKDRFLCFFHDENLGNEAWQAYRKTIKDYEALEDLLLPALEEHLIAHGLQDELQKWYATSGLDD